MYGLFDRRCLGCRSKLVHILRSEVLHLDRRRNLILKLSAYLGMQLLLRNCSEGIKVPLVVIPKRSKWMAAAGRAFRLHDGCTANKGMVNARSRLQQRAERGLFLLRSQGRVVIDSQLLDGLVEVEFAPMRINSVEALKRLLRTELTFNSMACISPLGNHSTTVNDHRISCKKPLEAHNLHNNGANSIFLQRSFTAAMN